jgi:GNAT superfamily N-acetyltransferase
MVDTAAPLLADRHRRHRAAVQALNPEFEQEGSAAERLRALFDGSQPSGAIAFDGDDPAAYVLGVRRSDAPWGANVWVEDAGCAGADGEAVRLCYAAAAQQWVDAGRVSHYVVVPATDGPLVDAWFSMGFGLQHVHALREPVDAGFVPWTPEGVIVRRAERRDLPALAWLDLVLPEHSTGSPVFAKLSVPSFEDTLRELEAEFDDPRFTSLVAQHNGRVVASATACSLELSNTNTPLIRPRSSGFLGYAAVLPDARGLGAGRALGEAVLAWSRDEGYEWVSTDWRSTNVEANRSWRAIGFRPSFLRLHRLIG